MTHILGVSSGRPDPLAGFDFAKLVASAAKLRPDRPALCDSALPGGLNLTFSELERAVHHSALLWRDLSLPEGSRVVIVAGARVAPVAAMLGALRAGLDVVLAPTHLSMNELTDIARTTGALALCGELSNGAINIAEDLFAVAMSCPDIRYVAMLTDQSIDGALTINISAFRDRPVDDTLPVLARKAAILTLGPDNSPVSHSQHALISAAVDFIAEARISMRQPVVSTLSVASFAGLVAGPLAGFMSGAQAFLHGPFDSRNLRELLSFTRQANVMVPAAVAQAMIDEGWLDGPEIGTLIALTRLDETAVIDAAEGPPLRLPRDSAASIIDIFALGEKTLAAERRAEAVQPAVVTMTAKRTAPTQSSSYAVEPRRANGF